MSDVLVEAEARLTLQQRFRIARARSQRLLTRLFDESQHPRDEHGKWTDAGGSDAPASAPKTTQGKGASEAAFAKIKAAVAAIPASHAAQISHVPVVLTQTSDEFPSHIAAGGGASTVGLFSWTNDQPRIDVAEAIKVNATITQPAANGKPEQSVQTESLLPIRQPEQVTVHELAHAFDYVNDWQPSADATLNQNFAAAIKQMTEVEAKNANYWISGGQREMFAELYSAIHNPNRGSEQTYFGGMTRERVDEVFKPAIADILKIKRFDPVRRAADPPPSHGETGWFVNDEGCLYALLNGMPYEVDVTGTPFAKLRLVPGSYADADALVAAAKQNARAHIQRFLKEWDEGKHPRVPAGSPDGGQFGAGGGGSESTAKPAGGKGKGKAKKEDFDKAKITIEGGKAQQDAFIEKWNDKVGEDPADFKSKFMGGLDGQMKIGGSAGKIDIDGEVHDEDGHSIGTFTRNINLDGKSAYSAYFKLNKSATKGDIGKKMLASNVETYKKLGIEKVTVTANIDVGGYAWAKYGYIPTASAWSSLRGELERKLGGGSSSSSRPRGDNTIEADDWSMLSSDVQDDVRDKWMRETHSEFLSSEEQNWRDSGQAKADAKQELAHQFGQYNSIPEWAVEAMDAVREQRAEAGQSEIPYTNKQLFDAIDLDYESYHGDGSDDPKITFDDDKLGEPIGYDASQGTLPGIEPIDPSSFLTSEMRDKIEKKMIKAFDDKAESDADDMTPPEYLADSVSEYQDEYWDQKDDSEKLQHAIDYGMADIEIEPDEDDEEPQAEMELPEPAPGEDPLIAALHSSDPKSIWKIADSPQGKSLLLGTTWAGVLNLKDKAQMERFDKYVGKAA